MKIFGIGTDIVNIDRLAKNFKKDSSRFKNKIFSLREISYCNKKKNSIASFAKRFAAKEAFTKALGTGFGNGISLKNIEVINNKFGKPSIKLHGNLPTLLKRKVKNKKYNIHLSLSDDNPWAQATVIILYK